MGTALRIVAGCASALLLTVACDRTSDNQRSAEADAAPAEPAKAAKTAPAETKDAPAATAKPRRKGPPAGLEAAALAVGQPAPALENLPSTQGAWSRGSAPAVVVFYRGFW